MYLNNPTFKGLLITEPAAVFVYEAALDAVVPTHPGVFCYSSFLLHLVY